MKLTAFIVSLVISSLSYADCLPMYHRAHDEAILYAQGRPLGATDVRKIGAAIQTVIDTNQMIKLITESEAGEGEMFEEWATLWTDRKVAARFVTLEVNQHELACKGGELMTYKNLLQWMVDNGF